MRGKKKVKAGISQLEKSEGGLTETYQEAAEILNDFFQSVFTKEPEREVPHLKRRVN